MSDEPKPEDDQPERKSAKPKPAKGKKAKGKRKPKSDAGASKPQKKTGSKTPPGEWRPEWKRKKKPRNGETTPNAHARTRGEMPTPPFEDVIKRLQDQAGEASTKEQILELMAEFALSANGAGRKLGISRTTVWRMKRDDEAFKQACEAAWHAGTDTLKDKASEMALAGDGFTLQFLIRGRDPSFRDPKYAPPVSNPPTPGQVLLDLDRIKDPSIMAVLEAEARRQAKEAEASR